MYEVHLNEKELRKFLCTCFCVDALPVWADVSVSGALVQIHALVGLVGLLTLRTQTLKTTNQIDALAIPVKWDQG